MLAAVLIIALVALALLGFFPGVSSDAKVSQSASYWRSEAKPIAVLDHYVNQSGTMTLVLQNNDAAGAIRITNISVANVSVDPELKIGPGEVRTTNLSGVEVDIPGSMYEFQINFSYISAYGSPAMQYGLKTLIGKYS
jgi:hypothetical protein